MNEEDALFLSIQDLVWRVVHSWCYRTTNLDPEEVFGDCMPSVVRAIRSYNPERGALTTFVHHHVTNHLMAYSGLRRWRARHSRKQVFPAGEIRLVEVSSFNLEEAVEALSPRARWLVHVALKWGLRKSRLVKKLRDEFAWETSEVKRVFQEIREALQ
jgi:hypothetical protein